jgi:predicted component of type VI protein secretion system
MPFIAVKSDRQEIDHRELSRSAVVGRAPDCDIQIRDILLSRHHCRLEETDFGWQITDLKSKNGTILNGQKLIEPVYLKDNDVVRVGRCSIVFHAGALEAGMKHRPAAPLRPADPSEALAGTLAGFTLLMPGEGEAPPVNQPSPQPKPKEPASYENKELRELLTTIASSSWDSIYAEASKATANNPPRANAADDDKPKRRARPRSPIDLSLQADTLARTNGKKDLADENMLHVSHEDAARPEPVASAVPVMPAVTIHRVQKPRRSLSRTFSLAALVIWVAAVATMFTWWTTHAEGIPLNPGGASAAPIQQTVPGASQSAGAQPANSGDAVGAGQRTPANPAKAIQAPALFW